MAVSGSGTTIYSDISQNTPDPQMTFTHYVDSERLKNCNLLMDMPVPLRVRQVKKAILFGRQAADPSMIRESYMKGKKDASSPLFDPFSKSFSLTYGPDHQPVNPEFKMEIAMFLMDALDALDAYGFVPWGLRLIQSQSDTKKTSFWVPFVPAFGLWKVRQMLVPQGNMDRIYQLQITAAQASGGGGGMLDDPSRLNMHAVDQSRQNRTEIWGGNWEDMSSASSSYSDPHRKTKGGKSAHKKTIADLVASNQARDLDAALEPSQKYGIYVVAEPTITGVPTSSAMSVVSMNERMSRLQTHASTAAAVASNPMLVTGVHSSGNDKQPSINTATTYLRSGDLTMTRTSNKISEMANAKLVSDIHDQAQNSSASAQASATTYIDEMTREKKIMMQRPFFDGNHYVIESGHQVYSQPMPKEPGEMLQREQAVDIKTAVIFGVPYSIAFGNENSRLKSTAEASQHVVDQVLENQGAQLAVVGQWILNHVFHDGDTKDLTDQLKARSEHEANLQYALDQMDEDDYSDSEDPGITIPESLPSLENAYKGRSLRKTREAQIAQLRQEQDHLLKYISMPARYCLRFAEKGPPVESILQLSELGLLDRKSQASLMASSMGISPLNLQLQDGPNKYQKAVMTTEAKAKNTGKPKPAGASSSSSSSSAKKKKKKTTTKNSSSKPEKKRHTSSSSSSSEKKKKKGSE